MQLSNYTYVRKALDSWVYFGTAIASIIKLNSRSCLKNLICR